MCAKQKRNEKLEIQNEFDENYIGNKRQETYEFTLAIILTLDYIIHMYFKSHKPDFKLKNLLWLLQPCAISHLFLCIILWYPQCQSLRVTQFLITSGTGTLLALLFPDTASFHRPFETEHFWFQHITVYILPFFYFFQRNALLKVKHFFPLLFLGLCVTYPFMFCDMF